MTHLHVAVTRTIPPLHPHANFSCRGIDPGTPIIGTGGVRTGQDPVEMLHAGASALGAASKAGGGLLGSVLACLAGGAVGGYLALAAVTGCSVSLGSPVR